jgi:hypothetical protein
MSEQLELVKEEFYILQASTNQTFGPLTNGVVREWIAQKRISKIDSVTKSGEQNWVPLLQSEFADEILNQISLERLAASTCPRCSAEMVVLVQDSKLGLWLIIVGVVLTPVFCIGTFLWVWGMILRHGTKGKTFYQCPRCKYTTN